MTHQYSVAGITCDGCISNVKRGLQEVPGITNVEVQKAAPQATVTMDHHIETTTLQAAAKKYGNYQLNDLS